MRLANLLALAAALAVPPLSNLRAEDTADSPATVVQPDDRREETVEDIYRQVRDSVVVVSFNGRDGDRKGVGTGFVVRKDGLIATNLHVLGEARPIFVETTDGKRYPVTSVHASDRQLDLALIRIDADSLPALPLADSDAVEEGQSVVAVGNPRGLKHSVVAGVISGKREIDGKPMFQLAMPIEQGNSGGPLVDMQGRALGIITMKSLVTENLGFAVSINSLRPLLEKPNPIPIDRWLTIGALDGREWTPLFGSHWRQRAGRLLVEGVGSGFGGRSLCVYREDPPPRPYEVAVDVKLDDESGAAGLIFCSNSGEKHYGFYPSAGKMRLTRFEGPTVFSWTILDQVPTPHYRKGDWNQIKVRLEEGKISCFVNEHLVVESTDDRLVGGKVGLAKFRDTVAEFRRFQVGKKIPSRRPDPATVARVTGLIDGHGAEEPTQQLLESLASEGETGVRVLQTRAEELRRQAERLQTLAESVRRERVQADLREILEADEQDIDLVHAALLIAKLDNDELDVEAYRRHFDRLTQDLKQTITDEMTEPERLAALDEFLFNQLGFHGSRLDYYNYSNSYLNEVLDDREGLPITLSVIYMELARRVGVRVVGVGLPGHFVVRHEPKEGEGQLIDVFDRGRRMTRLDAQKQVLARARRPMTEEDLQASSKRAILVRMLRNLTGLARRDEDLEAMRRYVDTVVAVDPSSAEDRWMRAILSVETGRNRSAIEDLDWFLATEPQGADLQRVRELRDLLERQSR